MRPLLRRICEYIHPSYRKYKILGLTSMIFKTLSHVESKKNGEVVSVG